MKAFWRLLGRNKIDSGERQRGKRSSCQQCTCVSENHIELYFFTTQMMVQELSSMFVSPFIMESSLTGIFLTLDYCQKIQLLGLFQRFIFDIIKPVFTFVLQLLVTKFSIEQYVKLWCRASVGKRSIPSIALKKKIFPNL